MWEICDMDEITEMCDMDEITEMCDMDEITEMCDMDEIPKEMNNSNHPFLVILRYLKFYLTFLFMYIPKTVV